MQIQLVYSSARHLRLDGTRNLLMSFVFFSFPSSPTSFHYFLMCFNWCAALAYTHAVDDLFIETVKLFSSLCGCVVQTTREQIEQKGYVNTSDNPIENLVSELLLICMPTIRSGDKTHT